MSRGNFGRLAVVMSAAGLAAASAFGVTATAAAAAAAAPHIVVRPDQPMVNTAMHLTGTGFPANMTLVVQECSQKTWIVPKDPCASGNQVTVTTNAGGGFKAKMTALVCPEAGGAAGRGFSEICYVGVPHPTGVDRVKLVGAAKITVTGP